MSDQLVPLEVGVQALLDLRDAGLAGVRRLAAHLQLKLPAAEWPIARARLDVLSADIIKDFDQQIGSLVAESNGDAGED
jgi:hypothetical protein